MRYASQLINLSKSALIDVEEGYKPLLYRLVILGTDIGGVSVGGAQVQCITTSTTAATQKSNTFINSIVVPRNHYNELTKLQSRIAKSSQPKPFA